MTPFVGLVAAVVISWGHGVGWTDLAVFAVAGALTALLINSVCPFLFGAPQRDGLAWTVVRIPTERRTTAA